MALRVKLLAEKTMFFACVTDRPELFKEGQRVRLPSSKLICIRIVSDPRLSAQSTADFVITKSETVFEIRNSFRGCDEVN
jgi:hypothetical protein